MLQHISTPPDDDLKTATGPTVRIGFRKWRIKLLQSDMYPYYETFIAGQYNSLEIRKGDRVLDAGASVGDFSLLATEAVGPSGTVVSLEPDPYYYSILSENLQMNKIENCTPLALALSSRTGTGLAFLNKLESIKQIKTSTITMKDLLKEMKLSHFDVIKLDVEGAEEEIFDDVSWLSGVRDLVVETHGNAFDRVFATLQASGFHASVYTMREMMTNALKFAILHPFGFAKAERFSKALGMRTAFKSLSHPTRGPKIVSGVDSLHIVHAKRIRKVRS